MNKYIIILGAGILAGLLAAVIYQQLIPQTTPVDDMSTLSQPAPLAIPDKIIIQKHYEAGTFTIDGMVTLPDPCYHLDANPVVHESDPEQVTIELTTTRSNDVCAAVLTPTAFAVSFTVSQQAVITSTLNGQPVKLEEGSRAE